MMAADSRADMKLDELLDAVLISHRKDIKAFAGGHLNESKLKKPPEQASHKPWPSSKKKHPTMRDRSMIPKRVKKGNEKNMESAMMEFSIGTSGAVPAPPKGKKLGDPFKKHKLKDMDRYVEDGAESPPPRTADTYKTTDTYNERNDGILVEELRLPEVMLPTPRTFSKTRKWASEIEEEDRRSSPTEKQKPDSLDLKHQFVPSHLGAVTKKDQFEMFVDFENSVLKKQDALEQKVLSGQKAVGHLEEKLRQDLDNLPYDGYGPNFHRLQMYSNTFEQLIKESPTFSYILKKIKGEYDNYVSVLLDTQTSQHRRMYEQVEQLSEKGTSKPEELKAEKSRVAMLESEAKKLLALNESLRREVQYEIELAATAPEIEIPKKVDKYNIQQQPKTDFSDKVQDLHTTIADKIENINSTQQHLKDGFVPTVVCNHLEQCIKESEIEIQKLMKQNEFYESNIDEMEQEITEAIDGAELSERDKRRIWRKVNSVRALGSARSTRSTSAWTTSALSTATESAYVEPTESDEEQEEKEKWDWYIS